jgi:parallel beta helix pectate lyase-like protein
MKRRAAVLLFAVAAAIGLCLGPAGATGRHHHGYRVLVVDNEPRHHRSCLGTRNPFDTIQGAVDVAPSGATIWVCPGLYEETVKVETPHLTINGANAGRDATTHGRGRESVVSHLDPKGTVQLLADDITWNGFTILGFSGEQNGPGMVTSPGGSGYLIRDTIFQDNGVGLRLGSSGKKPSFVCRNRFVANNEFDPTGGYGIFSDQPTRQVLITYNRFEHHNGGAILFADTDRLATHTDVLIDHNKSIDDLTFATIFSSSRLRLSNNDARDRLVAPDPDGAASAIYIAARNEDIAVHHNRVRSASGNGIDVTDQGEGDKDPAVPVNVVVTKNKVDHVKLAGLRLAGGTEDVTVTGNTALDNELLDCQDESHGGGTAGTNNAWLDNVGRTDSPDGLCSPPVITPEPGDGGHHHHHHKKHKKKDPCTCQKHPKAF